MKKTMKRILCLLLVVVMCLTSAPLQGFVGMDWSWLDFSVKVSAATEYTEGYYTYSVSNGKATITDVYTSISGDVTIPSTLGGYSVTTIGDGAFFCCRRLKSVTIPDSVTTIGYKAFYSCDRLANVTIGDSVTTIGESAFYYCNLASITIPDSVTTIGAYAFLDCYCLTSVTIGDGVTTIGNRAFKHCINLTSITVDKDNKNYCSVDGVLFDKNKKTLIQYPIGNVGTSYTIPDGVTIIGESAFFSFDSLTSVTIPDSVTTIGYEAFSSCDRLTSVTIGDGVLTIGVGAFSDCYNLINVTIGDSVSTIEESAFSRCSSLESVIIPDSVTTIGGGAFSRCYSLTSLIIPDNVNTIGKYAFYDCNSFTSIIIPDSVTAIGDEAFYSCDWLANVTIGDSVTTIGVGVFKSCTNLISITVDKDNKNYCSDDGVLFDKNKKTLIQYPIGNVRTSYTIPDSVTIIGDYAFWSCNSRLENIIISDSMTTIGDYAFYGCGRLGIETIPDSVTTIGDGAFYGCGRLGIETIPDSVTTIGDYAFYGCGSLGIETIPDSVTTIGKYAFYDCRNLTRVTIPDSVTTIGDGAFYDCRNLTRVTIPDSVTTIGDRVFECCYSLTSITIPDSVTAIGDGVFYGCDRLTSITIGGGVTTIGDSAFYNCYRLADVYYIGTQAQWDKISVGSENKSLTNATIHYNYKPSQTFYFMVSSDTHSVDSIHRKETAIYKINLLDENNNLLSVDDVTVQNNTTDIVTISTKRFSDTELELTVEPIKDGDASISLFNGDGSVEQFFNFTVYSNTTTYRADQVPVTNEKLKTNFSRGDMTVDNFEYYFDENKGKYIATMDVYNRSSAIGVVSAYTQDGLISDIEQVDPYKPLPSDFGEFLVYLGAGAVSIAKGENWNYRYSGYCKKTNIEIEVPEDGYLTVSCDVTSDNAAFIYNLVSIGVDFVFKTAEIIDAIGTDTDKLAKETTKTLAKKVSEYFNEDSEWTANAIRKLAKKLPKKFSLAYIEDISVFSLEMLDEMYENVGEDFSEVVLEVIIDISKEEIKKFGVMAAAKKLIKDKVIGVAEEALLKAASYMFDGGSYVNLLNSILGAYYYNTGTGKTMVVFKPNGEDGFLCKDTIKVKTDVITDEVLLNTYVIKDTEKEDAFIRDKINPLFNRDDDLDDKEISIDLNRVVEIHEISLLKNGEVVSDGFIATVEMTLPSYIDKRTCSVYRVEEDGTYTKLETKIEGNKIIFETEHFSEYVLTGLKVDVECDCICHKDGVIRMVWNVFNFFNKYFKANLECYCGHTHY